MSNLSINRLILAWLVTGGINFHSYSQNAYETRSSDRSNKEFSWPEGRRVALSLSFDDARSSQVDVGVPILDKYGVKATFYLNPPNMDSRLEQWKKASQEGHEMGNHTMTHPCTGNFPWAEKNALESFTLKDIALEMEIASEAIRAKLGVEPVSFAYPCGQKFVGRGESLRSYVPLVGKMFQSGRGWLDEGPNDPLVCDLSQLMGMESDNKTFARLKAIIDEAAGKGLWVLFAGHDIGDPAVQTTWASTLDSLCRYVSDPSNGIWIAPVGTVAKYITDHRNKGQAGAKEIYLDPAVPVDTRVEDLVSRMTLEEKIGQLNMPVVYSPELGNTIPEKTIGVLSFAEGKFMNGIGPGGGFFTLANQILQKGARQQAEFFNRLQDSVLKNTRLKIPLLEIEEGTHGVMCSGTTIFPEGAAIGSSWNTDLVKKIYSIEAREARAVGIHELCTLVIEPDRDPRLGRNIEGYSEDPYLCSRYAEEIVRAAQGDDISKSDKVITDLCHYPGQGQPVSGLERGAMEISERTLREVFLPPWEAGIKKGGALGVMATYPSVDGVPVHSSYKILTQILREELGFRGLVLSEGSGVNTLIYTGVASDEEEAGAMAANAGMDVSICFGQGYLKEMEESVKEGKVSEETIDRSVSRVLRIKFMLGLFENPFVNPEKAEEIVHQPGHQEVALEAAREGMVLLKNENHLLPLDKKLRNIAVIGPNADDEKNQLGDYTSEIVLQPVTTILKGIRDKLGPGTTVQYVKGCNVTGNDLNEISKAVAAAKRAQVAVVVVGENQWQAPNKSGTTGEGFDAATLELTGLQEDLVKAVYATGTPTVVILVNGRPLAVPWAADHIPALLEAWFPGEKGGEAVADVLFGDYNPGGKLPITVPRHAGQLPVYYDYKPSKKYWLEEGWGNPYVDLSSKPLYVFGYGLSYTTFLYSDLKIDPAQNGTAGSFHIEFNVKNSGKVAGDETAQMYIRDVISSVVRPVKELKGFRRVHLAPGESAAVSFTLTPEDLVFYDRDMNRIVEPGTFTVMIGSSSDDIRLNGSFEVTGSK